MLKRFEVENFKNFKDKFVFDLSGVKNYDFNKECVENGIVKKSVIYGPNACGKTNLGYAIFDIHNHLTDKPVDLFYQNNYLNIESDKEYAEFRYFFKFGNDEIEYFYSKNSFDKLIAEKFAINGKVYCFIDRNKSTVAEIFFKGADTLEKDLGKNNISLLRYVQKNTVLDDKDKSNFLLDCFMFYIDTCMIHMSKISSHNPVDPRKICAMLSYRNTLPHLEKFLNSMDIPCHLELDKSELKLYFKFDNGKKLDFYNNASTGTLSFARQFLDMDIISFYEEARKKDVETGDLRNQYFLFFVFIDEFDAYYHYEAAYNFLKELIRKSSMQIVLTTHNTSIMTNDLMRPDCYFNMTASDIKPLCDCTEKELRKAHNLEKMFKAKAL
jgi:AAA15 family ATPase/GTPase